MKKFVAVLCCSAVFISLAAEKAFEPVIEWSGYKARAVTSPQVTSGKPYNGKKVVRIEAVAAGKYQGAVGKFVPPVDFSRYSAMEFYIRHNIGRRAMAILLDGKTGKINSSFSAAASEKWSKVVIPLDKDSFKAQRGNTVNFSEMYEMRIAPFANMDAKGKYLELTGFKFLPKTSGTGQIKVMKYIHNGAKPTTGENGTALTDGDKKKNVHYRQFSDDPFITFDLGGKFTVDEIKVFANTAPSHNFAEIAFFSGIDDKDFVPAGVLRNEKSGTETVLSEYSFKSGDKPVVGRYIRLKATRPRSDFPVEFSEVEFFGHTPTDEEMQKAAALNYDTGVKMPKRSSKYYAIFQQGDYKLYISRNNGVVNGLYYKNKLIVERMTPVYTLQTRAKDTIVDGNNDKVKNIETQDGKVVVTAVNKDLPDLEIKRTYYVVKNALMEKVEVIDLGMKERKFLRLASEVILEQKFRSQGFYEMPGTALAVGMFRLPASEVQMDRSLTNIPTIGFENAATRQVIWHTRFKFNDRFTYMDVGTEEENLQAFRANGWRITSATIVPLDRKVHSFENRFSVTDGGMLKAYDEYISTPEAAAYRGQVKRPAWLRDLRAAVSCGWDSAYHTSSMRYVKNLFDGFSPRGYLNDPTLYDTNGIWGDVLSSGDQIYGWFGNRSTAAELKAKVRRLKSLNPNLKISYYTWFWSAFPWSTPVKNHPEWFVKTLRSGAAASWFPGVNVNYLRFWGIKESRDEACKQIVDFVNTYDQDNWYLDGGKSGAYAKDWDTMRIDDPLGQTDFYIAVRNGIQKDDPNRVLFFNHSENPLADIGYLESFGGTLTNEWRRGAILMWKFKMYAYKDPLHHSVYIYWLPGVDGAFHNYIAGIGVTASYNSRGFNTKDLPFLAARYEIRQAQITDADVKPDWRMDAEEDVECMTLHQGNNGWIFVNPHLKKPETRTISALTSPMNIKDPSKPIYAWVYTIRDGRKYKSYFGEKQIAEAYGKTGWVVERGVVPEFLGKYPYSERFTHNLVLSGNQAKVIMLSQVPAVVLSIENEPSHYYLAGQPGISLDGDNGTFTVNSEYKTAEIGMLLDENVLPESVTVNGKNAGFALRIDKNMRFAVVKVGQGKSVITLKTRAAETIKTQKLTVERKGRTLSVKVVPENASVTIYNDNTFVLGRTGSFDLILPDTVRNGSYTIKSGDISKTIKLNKLGNPLKLSKTLLDLKDIAEVKQLNKSVKNIKVTGSGTLYSQKASYAKVDVDNLKLAIGTDRQVENHFNRTGAMIEFQSQRYVKVRVNNGFHHFNIYGLKPQKHNVREKRPTVFGGLMLDFATPQGYTVRTAAGLGIQDEKRASINPAAWGKKDKCDYVFALDNLLISKTEKSKEYWLDLQALGAPENWNGKLALTLYMEDINPNRSMDLEILATAAQLPAGEQAVKAVQLGKKVTAVLDIKRIKGSVNWQKLPVLGELSATKATMLPLKTAVSAGWDDKNLYICYAASDTPGRKPNTEGTRINKPWFSDGVEFFLNRTDEEGMLFHIIIDVGNAQYAENMTLERKAGDKNIIIPKSMVKADYQFKNDRWTCRVTVPWAQIGGKPAVGKLMPFNLMRNRRDQGDCSYYSLVPSDKYFTGKQFQFKLTE